MKNLIIKEVEKMKDELWEINDYLYHNPEIGNKEFKAVEKLIAFLKKNNFEIEEGVVGKPTAFKAVYKSKKSGPNVAFLCEYDALPEVGHGCGHDMIAAIGAGAGAALSKVIDNIGGQVTVFGTPAEECDGAKVDMAAKGIFSDVDAAMMVHPADCTYESGSALAMDAIQFEFTGKASHAAAAPELGINALDGAIFTFNGINALRQHVTSDVRMHGIIKEGGVAANIVPDRAVAQFYVRAKTREALDVVVEKVKNIARGAALMTGATLKISNYEISYDNMNTNEELSKAFSKNLKYAGEEEILDSKQGLGSMDMGNVSRVVPAIHSYVGLGIKGVAGHSKEFADATVTKKAHDEILKAAAALALTGYDVITDSELLGRVKAEFEA